MEHPCAGCSEPTHNPSLCRDCDIEQSLDKMQCAVCTRMRYRQGTLVSDIAAAIWGEPCACAPGTPSVFEKRVGPG